MEDIKSMTIEEKIDYLSDLLSEKLEYVSPFVVVDSTNMINVESYIPYPFLSIDLAETKAGDMISYIEQMLAGRYPVLLLKNVDKISSRKDKSNWEYFIIKGLKSESCTFLQDLNKEPLESKEYRLPFSKCRVICTCSKYPEFLEQRGKLGWVGLSFP